MGGTGFQPVFHLVSMLIADAACIHRWRVNKRAALTRPAFIWVVRRCSRKLLLCFAFSDCFLGGDVGGIAWCGTLGSRVYILQASLQCLNKVLKIIPSHTCQPRKLHPEVTEFSNWWCRFSIIRSHSQKWLQVFLSTLVKTLQTRLSFTLQVLEKFALDLVVQIIAISICPFEYPPAFNNLWPSFNYELQLGLRYSKNIC